MTKALFNTIGGLLIAFVAGGLAQHDYSVADWWRGRGTWKSNPWVVVYEFELVK